MSPDAPPPEPAEPPGNDVDELIASLRPRLDGVAAADDIDRLVRDTYAAMSPVRVTTYMPILVERSIKDQLRQTPELDLREGRVTA